MKTAIVATLLLAMGGCVIDVVGEDDVGEAPGCRAVGYWTHDWTAREDELLDAINGVRATGALCGEQMRAPVPNLELAPALRCAARLHAADQAEEGDLSHEGSAGDDTLARIDEAQYDGVPTHELLAADFLDAEDVVEAWLASSSECNALLDASATDFGSGFARSQDGGNAAWVLLVGESRD